MMKMKRVVQEYLRVPRSRRYAVPHTLSKRFINVDDASLETIRKLLEQNFYIGWRSKENYPAEEFQNDLNAHLLGRLENDRRSIIPWLDNTRTINGSSVLEIGCGTGSSTVALAEQGARVTAVDIDEQAVVVAKERCKVYGVDVSFSICNATEVHKSFSHHHFDFVIFYACLEHMTHEERISAMKNTWGMLATDCLWAVIETPNRLWFYDSHTSLLPFFHWLPDELALEYSRFSPRDNFRELYRVYDEISLQHFLRRGRGASFHEFHLAIGEPSELDVVSSLSAFEGDNGLSSTEREFKRLLSKVYPGLHCGFYDPQLNLILKK